MLVLTREQHCLIAGIEIDAFKNLRQRRLLPTTDYVTAFDGKRGYLPKSTLLLMMALEFYHSCGLNREAASMVAVAGWTLPITYQGSTWPPIRETSLRISRGEIVSEPIMCGIVDTGEGVSFSDSPRDFALSLKDEERVRRFQGTMKELAASASVRRLILVNISEIVARMRLNAQRHAINLDGFWNEGW